MHTEKILKVNHVPGSEAFVKAEIWEVFIPTELFERLEFLADKYKTSIATIVRQVMNNPRELKIPPGLKRPRMFEQPVKRYALPFYGTDKKLWKTRILALECEFGTLVRYLLDIYLEDLEDISSWADFISESRGYMASLEYVQNNPKYGYVYRIFWRDYQNTNYSSYYTHKKSRAGRRNRNRFKSGHDRIQTSGGRLV